MSFRCPCSVVGTLTLQHRHHWFSTIYVTVGRMHLNALLTRLAGQWVSDCQADLPRTLCIGSPICHSHQRTADVGHVFSHFASAASEALSRPHSYIKVHEQLTSEWYFSSYFRVTEQLVLCVIHSLDKAAQLPSSFTQGVTDWPSNTTRTVALSHCNGQLTTAQRQPSGIRAGPLMSNHRVKYFPWLKCDFYHPILNEIPLDGI